MVFILAASSLSHALKKLPVKQQKRLEQYFFALPGASANPRATNKRKTLQHFLNPQTGYYRARTDIVVWHDLINNSLSKHPNNNNQPLDKTELIAELLKYKHNIRAIIYCQRDKTPNIQKDLKKCGIFTISLISDLLGYRKRFDPKERAKYWQLHQDAPVEWKTFFAVLRNRANLNRLVARKYTKKISSRRRRSKKRQALAALAEQEQN